MTLFFICINYVFCLHYREVHKKETHNGSFSDHTSDQTDRFEANICTTSNTRSDNSQENVPEVTFIHFPSTKSYIQIVLVVPSELSHNEIPSSSSFDNSSS